MTKVILGFVISLLLGSPAFAATYYASATGSGTTCSEGSPCTFSYAVGTKAQNGDTVSVAAGAYNLGGNVNVLNSASYLGAE